MEKNMAVQELLTASEIERKHAIHDAGIEADNMRAAIELFAAMTQDERMSALGWLMARYVGKYPV